MKFLIVLAALCAVAFGNGLHRVPQFGRIVGGQPANIDDFPYQVSVRIYDQHICGGSIIDANTVLTAAHCVYGMDHSRYSVRVGNTYNLLGQSVLVNSVRMNAGYNPNTIDNDVAILKLSSSLSFNSKIQAIALQNKGVDVPAGTTAWVSGWGATSESNQQVTDSLRAVDVAVITTDDCNRKYGPGRISSHMMCAQTLNHDSCQGDSGGPLNANGRLVGVVSWGIGCARPQYPGVYAKVSDLYDWIQANKY